MYNVLCIQCTGNRSQFIYVRLFPFYLYMNTLYTKFTNSQLTMKTVVKCKPRYGVNLTSIYSAHIFTQKPAKVNTED